MKKILTAIAGIALLTTGCSRKNSELTTVDQPIIPKQNVEYTTSSSTTYTIKTETTTVAVDKKNYSEFKNNLLRFSFKIPSNASIVYETTTNSKKGIFARFEGSSFSPGYVTFNASNGEYFKGPSEIPEGELGHVDWWKDYAEYQKKVITKKIALDQNENIIILNKRTYLETIYYDQGGENYLLNLVTYYNNQKYSFIYSFPAIWHENTYSWVAENRTKVIEEIRSQHIPEPSLTSLKEFWTTINSLSFQ
jgi:hypothetical protein